MARVLTDGMAKEGVAYESPPQRIPAGAKSATARMDRTECGAGFMVTILTAHDEEGRRWFGRGQEVLPFVPDGRRGVDRDDPAVCLCFGWADERRPIWAKVRVDGKDTFRCRTITLDFD